MTPVGIGWRHPHYAQLLRAPAPLDFIEVHSENFFGAGGAALDVLRQAREIYPVSLHGVGLALGSALGVDAWHLDQLARLVERIEPVRVSDHACFARATVTRALGKTGEAGTASWPAHASDLLPIPFNAAALDVMCANVQRVQDRLKRTLLVENLSAYLQWPGADTAEAEFLTELARRTGCGLLLDVNNIYVNALNTSLAFRANPALNGPGADPLDACIAWLDRISPKLVGEIHLAGHCHVNDVHGEIVIDDHGSRVCQQVWHLYHHAQSRFAGVATLIEWDTDVPALEVLLDEAQRARDMAGPSAADATSAQAAPAVWQLGRHSKVSTITSANSLAMESLAQQQQALVTHLFAPQDRAARALLDNHAQIDKPIARRGLLAYQANGAARAQRSLASAYPVLCALVGEEAFNALACDFWYCHPPQRGDLAQWGEALADFVQASAQLADEPYLGDVARVEWALHVASTALDAQLDAQTLRLLTDHDPGELVLRLCPGAACLRSDWPVASIVNAHLAQTPTLEEAGAKLRGGGAETALIWRQSFRPRLRETGPNEGKFVQAVLAGDSLGSALDGAPGFDFGAWLPEAVQSGLLIEVRML